MFDVKNLKANLDSKVLKSKKVIIVPHNGVDFDAIGSAIGISLIVKKLKQPSFILVNDSNYNIDHGVKLIIDEASGEFDIIDKNKYSKIADSDDLFILTDVNKKYLISVDEYIKDSEKVMIIDHHEPDNNTILCDDKYIDSSVSSASEIVAKLLDLYKIKIPSNIANYLLAGIYLDTNKLTKNINPSTMETAAKLMKFGANINKVTDLFTEDFMSDRRVQELVSKAQFISYRIAILVSNSKDIYTNEELAKAADYALKYGVDASFAIGQINEEIISINARGKERVDVSKIMQELGGGGNPFSGATKIKDSSIEETSNKLIKKLQPTYYVDSSNK